MCGRRWFCAISLGERTCDRDGSGLGTALLQVRAELLGFGLGFSKCQNRDDFSFEVLSGTLFFPNLFFFLQEKLNKFWNLMHNFEAIVNYCIIYLKIFFLKYILIY